MAAPRITIKSVELTKVYANGITGIKELTLEVYEGETFGIIGPNGAGKTTMIRLLTAMLKPTQGTAFVNGFNVLNQKNEVKKVTGLLPEAATAYENLSGREFLQFIGELYKVPKEILKKRVTELLAVFGLKKRENDLINGYSKGMKQRLILASTLIHDPKILFLDEPTSGLDPSAARLVKDLILALADQGEKTIFISTHQLALAEELADRVGILLNGQLYRVGSISQLKEETGSSNLEEVFLAITGYDNHRAALLEWR
ncbi:MAG: ABC transporter ATP-binding protein [Candidatus Hodarchaeota archaeon]